MFAAKTRHLAVIGAAGLLLVSCGQQVDQSNVDSGVVTMTTFTTVPPTEQSETSTEVETSAETSSDTPESSTTEAADECGQLSGDQALHQNIGKVRDIGFPWDTEFTDTSTYDPCATLSWILITVQGATGSSPNHIMLFNNGEYLGTATHKAYGFVPSIARASDNSIEVVYKYVLPGESNAMSSGRAHATFTWDEAHGKVVMSGEVPPDNMGM